MTVAAVLDRVERRAGLRVFASGLGRHWPILALILCAMAAAGVARFVFGYPAYLGGNDEVYWAQIVAARAHGFYYPISGALFVWLNEMLSLRLGWPADVAISVLGWVSIPFVVWLNYFVYRRWQGDGAQAILLALATTAYFWAPLLESKPQQWGQPLALLGAYLFFACAQGRLSWVWLLGCASLLAWTHNLSFVILLALCAWSWLVLWTRDRASISDGICAALALAPGMALMAWPSGPYGISVQAVWLEHIHDHGAVLSVVAVVGLAALVSLVLVRRLAKRVTALRSDPLAHLAAALSSRWAMLVALVVPACLIAQALLLPDGYWQIYGNSAPRFLLAQSGNLLFLSLTLHGGWLACRHCAEGRLSVPLQEALILLLGAAALCLAGLGATVWMMDNNWFLRIALYAVAFAAPLAAYSLAQLTGRFQLVARVAIVLAAAISLLWTLRWCGLVECAL